MPKDTTALAAICLAIGLAVVTAARRKTITYPTGRLVAVLLALPVLQALSTLWSASPIRALESAAFSLIWVLGILWFASLDASSRFKLTTVAAAGVVVSAAVMVLQIGGVQVFSLSGFYADGRLSLTGLTGNPADLAMAAVLLLPLLLVMREGSPPTRFQIVIVSILSLATLLTRTLTGIGALALVFIVWLIRQKSRALWVKAAIVGAVFLGLALAVGLDTRLVSGYEQLRKGDWYHLLSARGDGWSAASEMLRSRPFSGVGAANYDHLYYPSRLNWFHRYGGVGGRGELASHFNAAHSDPLQIVAEMGIFGLLWLIVLLVTLAGARKRAGPLLSLAIAAYTPFALLHYPTHLTVALIPIALIMGEIIGKSEAIQRVDWLRARVPVASLLMIAAIVGAGWQLRRLAGDLWAGSLEMMLTISQQAVPDVRTRNAATVEAGVLPRIDRMPRLAPTLWRTVGRARLMRRDFNGAETAFRTAYAGWPHEDADFYLGLTLVAQGRRSEGLQHLGQVCRTNRALVRLIQDPDLRRSVENVLEAFEEK
jgi:O-antigen ligase